MALRHKAGITRPDGRCGSLKADWQSAPHRGKPQQHWCYSVHCSAASRPITNRPQVGNLPHKKEWVVQKCKRCTHVPTEIPVWHRFGEILKASYFPRPYFL
jgi:hypothetical protein